MSPCRLSPQRSKVLQTYTECNVADAFKVMSALRTENEDEAKLVLLQAAFHTDQYL